MNELRLSSLSLGDVHMLKEALIGSTPLEKATNHDHSKFTEEI